MKIAHNRKTIFSLVWCIFILSSSCQKQTVPSSLKTVTGSVLLRSMPNGSAKEIHIGAIGDWGTGLTGQIKVFEVFKINTEKYPYDFLLTLGDNFYPAGVQTTNDPKWETVYGRTYGSLPITIYPSLGNHDHMGNVNAQIAYSKIHPLWELPSRYYSIVQPLTNQDTILFVALDTEAMLHKNDSAQLQWVENQLLRSKARWKIVFGHHPIFSHGGRGGNEYLRKYLQPILVKTKTDLFIAGHDHILELTGMKNGVFHAISGGGGGSDNAYPIKKGRDMIYGTTDGGFMDIFLSSEKIRLQMYPMTSQIPKPYILSKPVERNAIL